MITHRPQGAAIQFEQAFLREVVVVENTALIIPVQNGITDHLDSHLGLRWFKLHYSYTIILI